MDKILEDAISRATLLQELEVVIMKNIKNKSMSDVAQLLIYSSAWFCMHIVDNLIKDTLLDKKYELLNDIISLSRKMLKNRYDINNSKCN